MDECCGEHGRGAVVTARPCKCGLLFDHTGRCPHCDYPPTGEAVHDPRFGAYVIHRCPTGCRPCHTRDSKCVVCGVNAGSPTAAEYHQKECRAREARERG